MWASGVKAGDAVAVGFDSKVKLRLSEDQTVPTGTWTLVAWDTVDYDGLDEFDLANNRIVIAASGYYSFKFSFSLGYLTALHYAWCRLMQNGNRREGGTQVEGDASANRTCLTGGSDLYCTIGDLITVDVLHTAVGDWKLSYLTDGGTVLSMHRFA